MCTVIFFDSTSRGNLLGFFQISVEIIFCNCYIIAYFFRADTTCIQALTNR